MRWDTYIVTALLSTLVIAIGTGYVIGEHPRARRAGLVTIFGMAAIPVAIVLHNALSALIGGEEAVSFLIGTIVAPAAVTLGTLALAYQLRGSAPVAATGFAVAGLGLLVFPLYVLAAFLASALGGEIARGGAFEAIVLPASLVALVGGSIVVSFGLAASAGRHQPAAL
jgi:hypothetical protein